MNDTSIKILALRIAALVKTGERIVPARPAVEETVEEIFDWVCDEPLLAER